MQASAGSMSCSSLDSPLKKARARAFTTKAQTFVKLSVVLSYNSSQAKVQTFYKKLQK